MCRIMTTVNVNAATSARASATPMNGDDNAFGRGAHEASVRAQIEAGLVRLKTREDHRSLTVSTKRPLAGGLAMKNEGTERLSITLPFDEAGSQNSLSHR